MGHFPKKNDETWIQPLTKIKHLQKQIAEQNGPLFGQSQAQYRIELSLVATCSHSLVPVPRTETMPIANGASNGLMKLEAIWKTAASEITNAHCFTMPRQFLYVVYTCLQKDPANYSKSALQNLQNLYAYQYQHSMRLWVFLYNKPHGKYKSWTCHHEQRQHQSQSTNCKGTDALLQPLWLANLEVSDGWKRESIKTHGAATN